MKLCHLKSLLLILTALRLQASCGVAMDMPSNVSNRAAEGFTDPKALALAEAAARGDVRALERLVKDGADVNYAGRLGITPAWWAIRNRNKKGFEWLLAHGANPNPVVQSIAIMEMAAGYEDSEFLEIALRYKPNLNLVSRATGNSALDSAVAYSRKHNLELLVKAGADLNQTSGVSPVVTAARLSRYDYALLMLQAGADTAKIIPDGPNGGQNELAYTISHGLINPDTDAFEWRERVIRFLRKQGIEAHPPPNERQRSKPLPPDLR